jgi:hypothetical protein
MAAVPDPTTDPTTDLEAVAATGHQWRYADEAGVAADGPAVAFDSQETAEAWLSAHFEELSEQGISAVSLFDGDEIVYGPMPLAPE